MQGGTPDDADVLQLCSRVQSLVELKTSKMTFKDIDGMFPLDELTMMAPHQKPSALGWFAERNVWPRRCLVVVSEKGAQYLKECATLALHKAFQVHDTMSCASSSVTTYAAWPPLFDSVSEQPAIQ